MTAATVPAHVAVIPDGGRRWAKARGLSTEQGHKAGYDNLLKVADLAFERGIKTITGYVFSTENWHRSKEEVGYLMGMALWAIRHQTEQFRKRGITIRILGSREGLEPKLAQGLTEVEERTAGGTTGTIGLCFNYGGHLDLIEAVQRLAAAGTLATELTEEAISGALSSGGLANPDLIIRTGGEHRLSNFLTWESVYSELYFSDVLWPDFGATEFDEALADYAGRQRRFGH